MTRILAALLLALFLAPVLPADEASSFFDDSAVREIRLYFANAGWYNTLYQSHSTNQADPYFPAKFVYGSTTLAQVGARFKGNSSFQRNGVKKSFKLDFHEYDENGRFLGMKKLNLNNCDLQPSFMREKMFLDFAGKYIASMRAVHVRLYVNDSYYGLYEAIEQPDKPMLRYWFGDDEDGNLWEAGESVTATMSYLGAAASAYTSRYELKTNEEINNYSGLIQFLNILNNTPAADLPAKLEAVCDVDNMLSAIALNILFTNLESYVGVGSEYYLYQRSKDGRFVHIFWDTNETFGSTGDGTPRLTNPTAMDLFWLPTASTGGGPGGDLSRPLMTKLWAVDAYKRRYLRLLAKMTREGFDYATMSARQQKLANLIRADVIADPNKTFSTAQFEAALTGTVNTGQVQALNEAAFVRDRYAYVRPILDTYALPSDVRLNEIAAVNSGAYKDAAGDADPWVEIHNLGPGPVSLSGTYLTDDPAVPTKWALPAKTLADGEFLVIWLDNETAEGDTHSTIVPKAAGGKLYLFATSVSSTAPVDTAAYPALAAGRAYVRTGDYGDNWMVSTTITPGAANPKASAAATTVSSGTGELLINEIMADNDGTYQDPDEAGAYEDWFEIYNPGGPAVDMGGMYLTDNLTNPTKYKIPAGTVIAPGGHLVFLADSEPTQGNLHASFALSGDGEAVGLFRSDGKTVIDAIAFSTQQTDISIGRSSDGSAAWTIFKPATPGAANSQGYANWIVNAASYLVAPASSSAIASIFGENLASTTELPSGSALPETLAGVTVKVTDSAIVTRTAPLFFVSPTQINFQVPSLTAAGRAKVTVTRASGAALSGDLLIDSAAPGLFSANASGSGVGLLAAVRASASGTQTVLPAFSYNAAAQGFVATPIGLGSETDSVYLVLYGTGIRGASSLADVSVQVGGQKVAVTYAGAQSEFTGLDQVNVGPLPRALAGKGEVEIVMTVGGRRVNRVTVSIQ
jgi:uncharacterized protein (TIGR03437 family)